MTDDTTRATLEEVTTTVREHFTTAAIEEGVDGYEFAITICAGNRSEKVESRKWILADALDEIDCQIDHFDDFVPLGSSTHTTAYVYTRERIREMEARAEIERAAEVERYFPR